MIKVIVFLFAALLSLGARAESVEVRYRIIHNNATAAEGTIPLSKTSFGDSVGNTKDFVEIKDFGLLALKTSVIPNGKRVLIYASFELDYDFESDWQGAAFNRKNPGVYRVLSATRKVSTPIGTPGVIRIADEGKEMITIELTPIVQGN